MSEQPFCHKCGDYDFRCSCPVKKQPKTESEKVAKVSKEHLPKGSKLLSYEFIKTKKPQIYTRSYMHTRIAMNYLLGGKLYRSVANYR